MRKLVAIVLCMALLTVGCGSTVGQSSIKQKTNFSSEGAKRLETLERNDKDFDPTSRDALREFTVKTVSKFYKSGENNLYSPASLFLALAFAADIADESEVADLYELLCVKDKAELESKTASVMKNLNYNEKGQVLREINSVWVDENLPLSDKAKEVLSHAADTLYGDIYQTKLFENKDLITKWVDERTDGFLPNYKPSVDPDTVMAIYNVLYLNLKWKNEFTKDDVVTEDFTLDNGEKIEAEMVKYHNESEHYYKGENSVAAKLYYKDGSYCLFIRPNDGVEVKDVLDDELQYYLETVPESYGNRCNLTLKFPKIKYETKIEDIEKVLPSLGLNSIFGSGAFATIDPSLYVDSINQTTKIEMDEKGTKAVAVTEMNMKCLAAMPVEEEIVDITLDRSYAYVIMSGEGYPLFVGVVDNPNN